MELSKKNILSLIEKNKKKDFKIINLNIFGNEILLDIETNNPTLQSKKNIENSLFCKEKIMFSRIPAYRWPPQKSLIFHSKSVILIRIPAERGGKFGRLITQ